MDPIARATRFMARQQGAISTAQTRACGLTRDQVRQLVRSGRWAAARRGVLLATGATNSWEQRAWIKLLSSGPGALLSRGAAGFVLGLIEKRPEVVDVITPHRTGNGRVATQRAVHLDARDRRTAAGMPVTCPARTLVDLASVLGDRDLARAVDKALLKGLVTIQVVRRYIKERQLQRKRGVGRLIKLLDDREFGVPESELERRTIELIAEYRLPKPARQQRVGPHRVDFAYEIEHVVVEVDGRATDGT